MTTVAEINAAVGSMTGDTQYVLFTKADILRYLNWGMTELSRDLKITQKTVVGNPTALSTVDVVGGIILPNDFVTENAVYMGTTGSLARLTRIPQNIFWQDSLNTAASQPTAYTVTDYLASPNSTARHMLPYPHVTPGTSMYYRINYQYAMANLAGDTDTLQTPPIMDELLVLYITGRCKMQENDFAAANSFATEVRQRKQAILADFAEHSDFEFYTVQSDSGPAYAIWE